MSEKEITNWHAARSGASMTVRGYQDGKVVKLVKVSRIEPRRVLSTDGSGTLDRYCVAVMLNGGLHRLSI